jgi:putative flippase GtrA
MSSFNQIIKYSSVGIITNIMGYILYIGIANIIGLNPPIAAIISGFMVIGVSYYLNKRFSFQHRGEEINLAIKYYILYLSAILLHSFIILIFSNILGFAHEIIAGISLIIISCSLFLIQKNFLFNR